MQESFICLNLNEWLHQWDELFYQPIESIKTSSNIGDKKESACTGQMWHDKHHKHWTAVQRDRNEQEWMKQNGTAAVQDLPITWVNPLIWKGRDTNISCIALHTDIK